MWDGCAGIGSDGAWRLGTSAQCGTDPLESARTRAKQGDRRSSWKSEQPPLLRRLPVVARIALHTREVAGSKPAAPIRWSSRRWKSFAAPRALSDVDVARPLDQTRHPQRLRS